VGGALWADSLGPEGSSGDTYVRSIESNTRAIADGLSGGAVACQGG
jgi:zinc/manganese transport system substrate-binding protein/manganese/iron transport system substrate-binding protein